MKAILMSIGLTACCVLLVRCAGSAPDSEKPSRISLAHERVYLAPLSGLRSLAAIPGWPFDEDSAQALTDILRPMHRELRAEFRRCEKYGLYTVVDSLNGPTVTIHPTVAFSRVSADSLHLVLYLEIKNLATKYSATMTVDSWGLLDAEATGGLSFLAIGEALHSYRRQFPYDEAVGLFYPRSAKRPKKK